MRGTTITTRPSQVTTWKVINQETGQKMAYRYLGNTGIMVSVLGYGNWLSNFGSTEQTRALCNDAVKACWDAGVNFFDTAELYAFGQGELELGEALLKLKVDRKDYVLTTKIFWGAAEPQPNDKGLSRKHIIEGAKNSLKRLQHDYVDIIYAHRDDPNTPMEE